MIRDIGYGIWKRVAHPKVVTLATVIGYLALLYGWVPGLIDPPGSLESVWDRFTMYLVCSLIILGCVVGIPAALVGKNRVERRTIWAVIAGITLYVIIIHILHYSTDGNRLPQAGTVLALIPALVLRWVHVMKRPVASDRETVIGAGADTESDLEEHDD